MPDVHVTVRDPGFPLPLLCKRGRPKAIYGLWFHRLSKLVVPFIVIMGALCVGIVPHVHANMAYSLQQTLMNIRMGWRCVCNRLWCRYLWWGWANLEGNPRQSGTHENEWVEGEEEAPRVLGCAWVRGQLNILF